MSTGHLEGKFTNGLNGNSVPGMKQGDDELDFNSCMFGNGIEPAGPSFTSKLVRHLPSEAWAEFEGHS